MWPPPPSIGRTLAVVVVLSAIAHDLFPCILPFPADRGTALGDQMTTGRSPAFAYGSPVESVHWMPESKGIFTNPLNLIFGIQRQVSMEFDKDITARVYIIVLTARVDFKIEEAAALTVYENIASD